jgi:hypothetical protein
MDDVHCDFQTSNHACKHSGQYLVAIKGDLAIFDTLLISLCNANHLVTCEIVPHTINLAYDDAPICKLVKQSHIGKFGIGFNIKNICCLILYVQFVLVHVAIQSFWCQ